MRNWSEFGEQVNRLVYTLAGSKFRGNVEAANRFVAERINYSEASVRAMRQGRFRPRDDRALESLVELGATAAGLGSDWAFRLLCQGQHPAPKVVLERHYATDNAAPAPCPAEPRAWLDWFAWRVLGGSLGGLAALLLWSFGINRLYPAPHELPVLLEAVWGVLVGSGLAVGIALTDRLLGERISGGRVRFAFRYLALPLAGLGGALVWNLLVAPLFGSTAQGRVSSTWFETLLYGMTYGLSFAVGTALAKGSRAHPPYMLLIFAVIPGVMPLAGLLLATAQPAFANQQDVDVAVGILFRIGLLLPVAAFFPPLGIRDVGEDKPV